MGQVDLDGQTIKSYRLQTSTKQNPTPQFQCWTKLKRSFLCVQGLILLLKRTAQRQTWNLGARGWQQSSRSLISSFIYDSKDKNVQSTIVYIYIDQNNLGDEDPFCRLLESLPGYPWPQGYNPVAFQVRTARPRLPEGPRQTPGIGLNDADWFDQCYGFSGEPFPLALGDIMSYWGYLGLLNFTQLLNIWQKWPPSLLDQHPEAPDAATDRNATPQRKQVYPLRFFVGRMMKLSFHSANVALATGWPKLRILWRWNDMKEPRIKTHKA